MADVEQRDARAHARMAETLQLTVEEQLKRASANELFRAGDISGAVVAYEAALAETLLAENRLPLLSNLGFCHLKLGAPEAGANFKVPHELTAASECLLAGLKLGTACFQAPVLGAKVAGRQLEVSRRAGDAAGERAAAAECRFYISVAEEKGLKPPTVDLLEPAPPLHAVTDLLMAIGDCEDADAGLARVRSKLGEARGEALDENRMNALNLAVHISCLRPTLGGSLLQALLDDGTPVDARHENGRTALMLAANNANLALCERLLTAGADPRAVDGDGCTALHACCIDVHMAAERAEAGVACDPGGVAALLLTRGTPVDALTIGGRSARAMCERHRGAHECAAVVASLLEEWETTSTLAVTRL
jgi:hypothetical protein